MTPTHKLLAAALSFLACNALAGDWTIPDTIRQTMFAGLAVADYVQTKRFLKDQTRYEQNPLLTEHPSPTRLAASAILGITAHAAIAYMLPRVWRDAWQYGGIAIEADVVRHNHRSTYTGEPEKKAIILTLAFPL